MSPKYSQVTFSHFNNIQLFLDKSFMLTKNALMRLAFAVHHKFIAIKNLGLYSTNIIMNFVSPMEWSDEMHEWISILNGVSVTSHCNWFITINVYQMDTIIKKLWVFWFPKINSAVDSDTFDMYVINNSLCNAFLWSMS